jgi:hypothetical protein
MKYLGDESQPADLYLYYVLMGMRLNIAIRVSILLYAPQWSKKCLHRCHEYRHGLVSLETSPLGYISEVI